MDPHVAPHLHLLFNCPKTNLSKVDFSLGYPVRCGAVVSPRLNFSFLKHTHTHKAQRFSGMEALSNSCGSSVDKNINPFVHR